MLSCKNKYELLLRITILYKITAIETRGYNAIFNLGAGSGELTLANILKRKNKPFLLLVKEMEAGGLCRNRMVDNCPLDKGGGHFLDANNASGRLFV